ncbi:hypothetical protein M2437_002433 [Methylorubrum pseudosasae]|nr:hypothetical protein [Methylorubrum pseudosasae]
MDFLRHEVAVVALVDEESLRRDSLARPAHHGTGDVVNLGTVAGQDRPITLFEIGDLIGEGRERERVRSEIGLALPEADGQRRAVAGADQEIVLAREQEGQGEGAVQARQRRLDGSHRPEPLLHQVADELRHDLGVGLALEARARCFEFALQLAEILDDAVMDHRQPLGGVRVGIGLVGASVRGPAGMADADRARKRRLGQLELQVRELALGPAAVEPAVIQGGDAGRIVAAILEPPQRLDQRVRDRLTPDDADDSAHGRS